MAIDTTEIMTAALGDWGITVVFTGKPPIVGLFDLPAPSPGPYLDDPGETPPQVTVRLADLQAIGQWPLTATELTCEGSTWSIVRPDKRGGEVTIILREQ